MPGRGNPAGLKPWKPGQSGNPNGRPRKKPVTEAYEKSLLLKAPKDIVQKLGLPPNSRWADVVAAGMVRSAVKGNVPAAKEIADRVEGPVNEAIEGTIGMTAIAISVQYDQPKQVLATVAEPPTITIHRDNGDNS